VYENWRYANGAISTQKTITFKPVVRERIRDGGGFGKSPPTPRRAGRFACRVSGTAAIADGQVLHPGDSFLQTQAAISKALASGGRARAPHEDVFAHVCMLAPSATGRRRLRATGGVRRRGSGQHDVLRRWAHSQKVVLVEVELDAIVDRPR
jgi:hypothetical protein